MDGLFFLKDFAAQSGLSWVRFAQMASFDVAWGILRWKWGFLASLVSDQSVHTSGCWSEPKKVALALTIDDIN